MLPSNATEFLTLPNGILVLLIAMVLWFSLHIRKQDKEVELERTKLLSAAIMANTTSIGTLTTGVADQGALLKVLASQEQHEQRLLEFVQQALKGGSHGPVTT